MDDIILVQPWSEKGKWFKRSFWYYSESKTYSVDELSDGDHEDCDEDDLPNWSDVEKEWLDYYRHVAETGEDPLDEFYVKRSHKVKQVWYVAFSRTADGTPYLTRIKHAGRYYAPFDPAALPKHVKDYLWVEDKPGVPRMELGIQWDDLVEALGIDKLDKLQRIELEYDAPFSARRIRQQLQKLARRSIRQKEASIEKQQKP